MQKEGSPTENPRPLGLLSAHPLQLFKGRRQRIQRMKIFASQNNFDQILLESYCRIVILGVLHL
jgi:hypothetical protein